MSPNISGILPYMLSRVRIIQVLEKLTRSYFFIGAGVTRHHDMAVQNRLISYIDGITFFSDTEAKIKIGMILWKVFIKIIYLS